MSTCQTTKAYTLKPNPYANMSTKYTLKPNPYAPTCFDFVIKMFQDENFFAFQDDSQFIFNLETDTI